MTRTGGERTRKKILEAAEELFSKNGFHATTIKQITREAGVNQGLVYYYFKDKNDIVVSLFKDIVEDLSGPKSPRSGGPPPDAGAYDPREALKEEMSFLNGRRKIISVMLLEALKTGEQETSLFRCADLVMSDHAHEAPKTKFDLVHEFFTGFIPLVAFVALQEKFCDYFHCDEKEALDLFVDSFMASHVNTRPSQEVHRDKRGS
jgi:AcrR family transcriptional regulator